MATIERLAALCAGTLLLYVAFFLEEDEEGRLQNSLERFWRTLAKLQESAMFRQTLFLRHVAVLTSTALDRLFGERLISIHASAICACYSLGSISIGFAALLVLTGDPNTWDSVDVSRFVSFVLVGLAWTTLGVLPAVTVRMRHTAIVGLILIAISCTSALLAPVFWEGSSHYGRHPFLLMVSPLVSMLAVTRQEYMAIVILVLSVTCDCVSLAVGRCLVRGIASRTSLSSIIGFLCGTVVLTIALCVVPIVAVVRPDRIVSTGLLLFGLSNVFGALVGILFAVVTTVALMHRLIWPALRRPVMAAHRHGLLTQRKLVGGVGVGLLASSTTFGQWLENVLKHVHITFG